MKFLTRKLVTPADLNPRGTLHGGQLLKWIDEEGKFKNPVKNLRATNAWFRWMHRTGHVNIPGDFITGKAVIYKKI